MNKIIKMNENLANMIAAGEVVERPASVLKELVENSIDANSDEIIIYINNIGLDKIRVIDNGLGIFKDDLENAFLRHATSKIFNQDDLLRIKTLGFRGEALAAIESVSKVFVKSKTSDEDGYYLKFENGKVIEKGKASLNRGTDIEVLNLFYNVPARFKYLKSEYTEKKHLINVFEGLALSNPNISFSLYFDDVLYKRTAKTNNFEERIANVMGENIIKNLKYFSDDFQKINIKGYLISPQFNVNHKNAIYTFINGRYIKNYLLTNAVIEGYNELIMTNRYPISFIFLTIDPSLTDVNIHPQKLEIKLANEYLISFHLAKVIANNLTNRLNPVTEKMTKINDFNYKAEKYIKEELFNLEEETVDNLISESKNFPNFEYIGQLFGTYLLFQNEEGLYLVDQHAAEERVRYEYYQQVFDKPLNFNRQMILAYHLELPKSEIEIIKNYQLEIEKFGFKFNDQMQIIQIPIWLKEDNIETSINIMTDLLEKDRKIDLIKLRDNLAKDVSCKSSIKANKSLSRIEVNKLMIDLKNTNNPYSCPHGRPTIIKISNYEIEKLFKRVV